NFQRNSLRGPGYWSIDMALSRLIAFGPTRKVELRVETFNLLNTFNWGPPTLAFGADRTHTNFTSGVFGPIRSMEGPPRIMQFGVKYGFRRSVGPVLKVVPYNCSASATGSCRPSVLRSRPDPPRGSCLPLCGSSGRASSTPLQPPA